MIEKAIFGDNSARRRHRNGCARRLAGPLANAYPHLMCRNITSDQQIEGWRAFVELLGKLNPRGIGVMTDALMACLHHLIPGPSDPRPPANHL